MVFNLSIAVHKLRAFHYCGISAPPEDPEALLIYSAGWTPHTALIRTSGTFKSLGVEYPISQADSTSLQLMKQKLLVAIRALSIKKASPRSINLVMAKCLYARGAYVGILSSCPSRNVKKSTPFSLQNFAAVLRTFAPRRLKTYKGTFLRKRH